MYFLTPTRRARLRGQRGRREPERGAAPEDRAGSGRPQERFNLLAGRPAVGHRPVSQTEDFRSGDGGKLS